MKYEPANKRDDHYIDGYSTCNFV